MLRVFFTGDPVMRLPLRGCAGAPGSLRTRASGPYPTRWALGVVSMRARAYYN